MKNNLVQKLLIGGLGITLSLNMGCQIFQDSKKLQKTIRVSECKQFPYKTNPEKESAIIVCYHGMPNKETFSISKGGCNARNFYPANSKKIYFEQLGYRINGVYPDAVTLTRE